MNEIRKRVGAIIMRDGKILLAKIRDNGYWTLPGGGIEENETLENALSREIMEETSLQVVSAQKYGEFLSDGTRNPLRTRNLTFAFLVETTGTPVGQNEISEAKWFSASEALKLEKLAQSAEFFVKKLAKEKKLK
ncbi:MAG: NUDIX hydrolase [Candidatus Micrarchaeota archaeon]|nr:NUDIX hydrolase [Candidatus Micrarchaeota archaeon]